MEEIKIKDAEKISKESGYPQIIIFGNDPVSGTQHVTTFGKTKKQCLVAADMGNSLKKTLGWPKNLCNAKPSKTILDDKMEYKRISTTEMKPDIYGGKECNEHIPRWVGQFYDEENTDLEEFNLDPKAFPPGTKVFIEVPLCPNNDCGMEPDLCECGFDWKKWTDQEYC